MKQKFNYTSVDTIFAKFSRDLRGTDLHESDVIEWIGEALGFMKVVEIQEEAVAFIEVKDFKAELPIGFQSIIQIAKDNYWSAEVKKSPCDIINSICNCENTSTQVIATEDCGCTPNNTGYVVTDCQGKILNEGVEIAYYRPYFDLKYEYQGWCTSSYYTQNFSPVRLANNSFFNSLVCTENNPDIKRLYQQTTDEYTIAGGYPDMQLRFSFKEGYIALAYLKNVFDEETGYPVIPDDISFITAITYYVKWKIAERYRWNGREGFAQEAQDAEAKWLKYVRQAINKAKMPTGVDQYQNMMEQSLYLIPRTRKYYGYFGNLGREEYRRFNNPDFRRRMTYGRY